jgi:serine/threonine-protein kinase ULK4
MDDVWWSFKSRWNIWDLLLWYFCCLWERSSLCSLITFYVSCGLRHVNYRSVPWSVCVSVSAIQDIGDMAKHAGIFLELSGSREPPIAEAAAECLVLTVKASPSSATGPILSNMGRIVSVLETSAQCHTPSLLTQLQCRILYVLMVCCKEQRIGDATQRLRPAPTIVKSDFISLENIVIRLRKSSSPQVAEAAVNAVFELQCLPRS